MLRNLLVSRFVQKEVVFYKTLAPTRIAGAIVIQKLEGEWQVVRLVENQNFSGQVQFK